MNNFIETLAMKKQKGREHIFRLKLFLKVLLVAIAITLFASTSVQAKSLYLLTDIRSSPSQICKYDIENEGDLTFQSRHNITKQGLGAVDIAIDSDNGYLFITHKFSEKILLVNSTTMEVVDTFTTEGANYLYGIEYDSDQSLLYCIDFFKNKLFIYRWDPAALEITLLPESPVLLEEATGVGITLDEINDVLYVANGLNNISVYSTSDWSLQYTIGVTHGASSIAIDVKNGFLYYSGGNYGNENFFEGNNYLTQYQLATKRRSDIQLESGSIIMGLGLDFDTGYVYMSVSDNTEPDNDMLYAYDRSLNLIDSVITDKNPTGLVIPGKNKNYNPFNISFDIIEVIGSETDDDNIEPVDAGDFITYLLCFNRHDIDYEVRDLSVVFYLPKEVSFISSDEQIYGKYDSISHTYSWEYPYTFTQSIKCLEMTVRVNKDVPPGTSIVTSAIIDSDSTSPISRSIEIFTSYGPLNVSKTVVGAIENEDTWIDIGETVIYSIYVDNKDNNMPASDILVVDVLPDEISFLGADVSDYFGEYDLSMHTFTWSCPYLEPGASIFFELRGQINSGVARGNAITNRVIVDSKEAFPATSCVDILAGDGPPEVNDVQIVPSSIRRGGALTDIMVVLELPEGITLDNVSGYVNKDVLLMFEPGGIEAKDQIVRESEGKVTIIALFNVTQILEEIQGYGQKEVYFIVNLDSGGYLIGNGTITITRYTGS